MSAKNSATDLWIVYDGECPFCRSYVRLYRLRSHVKQLHLIDARTEPPIVDEIRRRGLDLDRGMAVKLAGHFYHGAEAIQILAILGSGDTLFNRMNRALFRHPSIARWIYPLLVQGRLLTLRLLCRTTIDAH